MTIPGDSLGSVLRDFYRLYGLPGEGPPADANPSSLLDTLGEVDRSGLQMDLDLLRRMNADRDLHRLVRECDGVLEEIANEAGQTRLLEEMDQCYEDMALDGNAVFSGIMWYAQACNVDPRRGNQRTLFPPLQKAVNAGAPALWALGQQVTGAAVLRLYVALVYLRGDWVREAIGRAQLDSTPSLLRYARLLAHDVTRHLRNALSHGHFKPTCAGMHITDRQFEAVLTPGMLDKLCTWIFIFHYSVFMVYARRQGIKPPPIDDL